jgi:hypothetical protein
VSLRWRAYFAIGLVFAAGVFFLAVGIAYGSVAAIVVGIGTVVLCGFVTWIYRRRKPFLRIPFYWPPDSN